MGNTLLKVGFVAHAAFEGYAIYGFHFAPKEFMPALLLPRLDNSISLLLSYWTASIITQLIVCVAGLTLTTAIQKRLVAFALAVYHVGASYSSHLYSSGPTAEVAVYAHAGFAAVFLLCALSATSSSGPGNKKKAQ